MDGYTLAEVPLSDEDACLAYCKAVNIGFLEGDPSDVRMGAYLGQWRADGVRLLGCYPTSPMRGLPEGMPVGTFSTFTKSLNLGAALVDAHLISDVTVRPSHRRRGILTAMMHDSLDAARAAGLPVALLTASEATIYGRFGFGVAAHRRAVELKTRPAGVRVEPDGRTEVVDAASSWPLQSAVYARYHATTRGSVDRPALYEGVNTGAFSMSAGGPDSRVRVAVHWDAAGEPDGTVVYVGDEEARSVTVKSLVATTPDAELQLWRFLTDIDLVETIVADRLPWGSVLPYALADSRALRVTKVTDALWLRVLDLPATVAARSWDADGAASFRVVDPLGHVDGCWRLEVREGRGTATPTDAADVTVPVDALGSLVLGDVDVAMLAGAGRITGTPDAVAALDRLFATRGRPDCLTAF